MAIVLESEDLEHLQIKCITALCDRDLHCFLPTRKAAQKNGGGACRKCRRCLVDFVRTAKRDLKDIVYTTDSLKKETIRAKFWRKPIPEELLRIAKSLGRDQLRVQARQMLEKVVGPKPKGTPWDSQGTKFDGNVIFFAQHATACCCRRCAQEWHGISDDHDLTSSEIDYMLELVMYYVEKRIPDLPRSNRPHQRDLAA